MLSSEEGIAELRKMPGERLPERLKAEAFIFLFSEEVVLRIKVKIFP